jgi:hypothetical protein
MMMNEEADPDDLQAVFAHEYEDVYDFQVRRRQHPFTVVSSVADPMVFGLTDPLVRAPHADFKSAGKVF